MNTQNQMAKAGTGLAAMDPKILERAKALASVVDQRVSKSGAVSMYEIDRLRGGFRGPDGATKPSLRVIPLLLRETRAYWAKEGTGDRPDCRSINGLVPLDERDGPEDHTNPAPQSETCSSCPWNKFGTDQHGRGKKCKTKATLFAAEVGPDGRATGSVIGVRFSLSNRSVGEAIAAADRKVAELKVPRFLTVWELTTSVWEAKGKKGAQDYTYFNPTVVGYCDAADAEDVVKTSEGLADGGADNFLRGAGGIERQAE